MVNIRSKLLEIVQSKMVVSFNDIVKMLDEQQVTEDTVKMALAELVDNNQIGIRNAIFSDSIVELYYWLLADKTIKAGSAACKRQSTSSIEKLPKRRSVGLAPVSRKTFSSPLLKSLSTINTDMCTAVSDRIKDDSITHKTKINAINEDGISTEYHGQDVLTSKAELMQQMQDKESKLRKLKLVKMYESQANIGDLDELIIKWRDTSQGVAKDLYDRIQVERNVSMTQFLKAYHIDMELIRYSAEEEAFV